MKDVKNVNSAKYCAYTIYYSTIRYIVLLSKCRVSSISHIVIFKFIYLIRQGNNYRKITQKKQSNSIFLSKKSLIRMNNNNNYKYKKTLFVEQF